MQSVLERQDKKQMLNEDGDGEGEVRQKGRNGQ
jgi:hypothetical protein